jgi:hypothetical protein
VIFETERKKSRHILHQHWYICLIVLPVRRNRQPRSLLTVASATCAPMFQPNPHQRNVCYHPNVSRFRQQTLPTANRKHFFINIVCIKSFCQQKPHNRTVFLGSTLLNTLSPFWLLKPVWEHAHTRLLPRLSCSWNVLLSRDTENLLRSLQLFYFACSLAPSPCTC